MALIKKLALGSIFISILSIFAMSHNASALNINFENYSILSTSSKPAGYCADMNNTQYNFVCNIPPNNQGRVVVRRIQTNTVGYQLKAGDIIEFYVSVYTNANFTISGGTIGLLDFRPLNYPNIIHMNIEEVQSYDFAQFFVSDNNLPGENVGFVSDFWTNPQFFRTYKITQYVGQDGTYNIGLAPENYLIDWFVSLTDTTRMTLHDLTFYRYAESKENKEVEQKTQEAVDDSEDAGSDSSSAASSGGANLLTAITGFFNVITSAQPTNCRFNAPLNTYFGNQNLNVDLCALDLPSGIGALTSIIAIGILIPFAIHMFNKFIALFRSFQS